MQEKRKEILSHDSEHFKFLTLNSLFKAISLIEESSNERKYFCLLHPDLTRERADGLTDGRTFFCLHKEDAFRTFKNEYVCMYVCAYAIRNSRIAYILSFLSIFQIVLSYTKK